MDEVVLKAEERREKPRKVREAGFIPGVLYGAGAGATSVQFDAAALKKVIMKNGSSAKLWIQLNDTKKFGFIKEVQKHPVEGKIIHIDVQMVSQDQEIKLQLPITYTGIEELEKRQLILLVTKSEVEVVGKANLIPNVVISDVSTKEVGDNITFQDFNLDPQIRNNDGEEEIYAVIKVKKEQPVEEETTGEEPAHEEPEEEEETT
ncbi:MAG: 50S ribosomal protein L25 [Dehalobacterium sp.]